MKVIKRSVSINAPKEKVWDVLVNNKLNRIWYAEFSAGTIAETDWQIGSKAVFKDESGSGLIAEVTENKPNEILSVEYKGMLSGGKEEYDSEEAKSVQGGGETYVLKGTNGRTDLTITCDLDDSMYDAMLGMWDKALQRLKQLAESEA